MMADLWLEVFPPERRQQCLNVANHASGPKNMPDADTPPVIYFLLMFTANLLRRIVRETNRYADQYIRQHADDLHRKPHSRVHTWKPLTMTELKGFLAVILNMGLIRKPSIEHYWRKVRDSQATLWFTRMFTRNRFQIILKFLHIIDNRITPGRDHPHYNPAAKFQPILDHFNMRSSYLYVPQQEVCVDESLVGTTARSVMTQYIPSKKSKFGIKLWMLVESATGFIIRIICYRGRRFDPVERGHLQEADVVQRLLSEAGLLNKSYHVYCDSFFTSLRLAGELLTTRTYLTGTLRSNAKMPNGIKNANLQNNRSKFMRRGNVLCVAYKDNEKKAVKMLSIFHNAKVRNQKPRIVRKYNRYMGAVDLNDMMTTFYCDKRKTVKMWKKVFFNLLHRFAINAYLLYKQTCERPVTRLRFTEEIIEALAREHLQTNRGEARGGNRQMGRRLRRGNKRDCSVCSRRAAGMRRRTSFSCTACRKPVHPLCMHRHVCTEE